VYNRRGFQLLGTSNLEIPLQFTITLGEPIVVFLQDRIVDANSMNTFYVSDSTIYVMELDIVK